MGILFCEMMLLYPRISKRERGKTLCSIILLPSWNKTGGKGEFNKSYLICNKHLSRSEPCLDLSALKCKYLSRNRFQKKRKQKTKQKPKHLKTSKWMSQPWKASLWFIPHPNVFAKLNPNPWVVSQSTAILCFGGGNAEFDVLSFFQVLSRAAKSKALSFSIT